MSDVVGSELARHYANLAHVAASPANKYGLAHGCTIMPDTNDPYGRQAFEEERARQKCLAGLAQHPSLCTSTTAATTTSTCGDSDGDDEDDSDSSEDSHGGDDDDDNDDNDSCDCICKCETKTKKRCSGAWCKRQSLSFQRSKPHWCDGKKWGGKIWGLSRTPGDKRVSNWLLYFDPKVSKSEIEAICRRRCPPEPRRRSHKTRQRRGHHRRRRGHCRHGLPRHCRVKTKVVVCGACQGIGCVYCQNGGVLVPIDCDYTGDVRYGAGYGTGYGTGHSGDYTGSGGYGHYGAGGLPGMPPHRGYAGHPAGNLEHWRVHSDKDSKKKEKDKDKDKDKDRDKDKDGSQKGSKAGSKDSSDAKGNTMAELAGRMQTMKRNEKGFWGGEWEKAADGMMGITERDLRVLEKGYQAKDKDGKGAGDDAAKWLWGRFGNVGGPGGGGGRGGAKGGGVFYGRGYRGGGSMFTGDGGGGSGGGGGGGGGEGGIPGQGGVDSSGRPGSGGGGTEGGSRKAKSVNGSGNGGAEEESPSAPGQRDNGGEGPSNVSARDTRSASRQGSQRSKQRKGKGEETAGSGDGGVDTAVASASASHYPPSRHSTRQHASSQHTTPPQAKGATANDDARQSRFERLRQRLDDAGRLRTGSWERVSPALQREREWQRQQAMKEEWQKIQAEERRSSRSGGEGANGSSTSGDNSSGNSPLLRDEENDHARAIVDQLLMSDEGSSSRNHSPPSPAEFVTRVDGAQYPLHPDHLATLARRRGVSDTVSYVSLDSTTSVTAPARSPPTQSIHGAHSTSGDTGYETGHDAGEAGPTGEANARVYAGRFSDPGYGSLYDIPGCADYAGYPNYSGYAGWGPECADNAAWGGVSSSSTTLRPSSMRTSSKKSISEGKREVGRGGKERGRTEKGPKGGKDKDDPKKGKKMAKGKGKEKIGKEPTSAKDRKRKEKKETKETEKKIDGKSESPSSWTTCLSSRGSHSH